MTHQHKRRSTIVSTLIAVSVAIAVLAAYATPAIAQSSSAAAYGGQGNQITPISEPGQGQLPFTGLDVGVLLLVAALLIGLGVLLRSRLRRGGRHVGDEL